MLSSKRSRAEKLIFSHNFYNVAFLAELAEFFGRIKVVVFPFFDFARFQSVCSAAPLMTPGNGAFFPSAFLKFFPAEMYTLHNATIINGASKLGEADSHKKRKRYHFFESGPSREANFSIVWLKTFVPRKLLLLKSEPHVAWYPWTVMMPGPGPNIHI